jgi:hypothetical protein
MKNIKRIIKIYYIIIQPTLCINCLHNLAEIKLKFEIKYTFCQKPNF